MQRTWFQPTLAPCLLLQSLSSYELYSVDVEGLVCSLLNIQLWVSILFPSAAEGSFSDDG